MDETDKRRTLAKLCRDLNIGSNIIGTDFADVQVEAATRSDRAGVHVSFFVSWDALGKMKESVSDAVSKFFPDEDQGASQ